MEIGNVRAIVTGAGSGMGRFFALEIARNAGRVVAVDIDAESLSALASEASSAGLEGLHTHVADVSDEASVVGMVAAADEWLDGANLLVNNAGLFRDGLLVKKDRETGAIRKMSLSKWQKVIDVDLTGPFLCTREFAARVIERGTPSSVVVNISSVSRRGNVGQSNYSAAKAGLVADTRLWARELARYGVRVGAVAPGFIRTPILDGMPPGALDKMLGIVALRRVGEPVDIWRGVRFIVECDYFTGSCLEIDGGTTM